MLHHVESPDVADLESALIEAAPQAAALIEALRDCCHPRRGRLIARLRDCGDPQQLELLHAEVFNLLALSFGPAEAERRLHALE